MNSSKVCKKCGINKSLDEFYHHKEMKDRHLNICKSCICSRVSKHRKENIEKVREYDRNRPNAQERSKKNQERIAKNPELKKKYMTQKKEWAEKNKIKVSAQRKVQRAVRMGLIKKPKFCERCGSDKLIQGHHHDYTKPLDVIWLCYKCHQQEHKKLRMLSRGINNFS